MSILIYTAGLEETLMKNFTVALFAGLISLAGISAQAATPEQECQKLKNDYNVIYASKGFCFKDKMQKRSSVMKTAILQNLNSLKKSSNVLMKLKSARKS